MMACDRRQQSVNLLQGLCRARHQSSLAMSYKERTNAADNAYAVATVVHLESIATELSMCLRLCQGVVCANRICSAAYTLRVNTGMCVYGTPRCKLSFVCGIVYGMVQEAHLAEDMTVR